VYLHESVTPWVVMQLGGAWAECLGFGLSALKEVLNYMVHTFQRREFENAPIEALGGRRRR